jgi:hypothetical protein
LKIFEQGSIENFRSRKRSRLKNFKRKNDRDKKILIAINPEIRNAFTSGRPLFLMEIFHARNRENDRV